MDKIKKEYHKGKRWLDDKEDAFSAHFNTDDIKDKYNKVKKTFNKDKRKIKKTVKKVGNKSLSLAKDVVYSGVNYSPVGLAYTSYEKITGHGNKALLGDDDESPINQANELRDTALEDVKDTDLGKEINKYLDDGKDILEGVGVVLLGGIIVLAYVGYQNRQEIYGITKKVAKAGLNTAITIAAPESLLLRR